MRRFHLIRHAEPDCATDLLNGRLPGIHLSARGRAEAASLARHFAREDWTSLLSSPVERCQETAQCIAAHRELHLCEDLLEIDYGAWSGQSFTTLQRDAAWQKWNNDRGRAQTAGGDSLARVATSLIRLLDQLPPEGTFLLVTHAEVILCFTVLSLNLPLGCSMAFDINYASISTFEDSDGFMRCCCLNQRALS